MLTLRLCASAWLSDDLKKVGWLLGKELGSGHFAKVKLVTRESDGVTAACKIIKKPKGARYTILLCSLIFLGWP